MFQKPHGLVLPDSYIANSDVLYKYMSPNILIRYSSQQYIRCLLQLLGGLLLGKRLHVANLGCGDSFISAAMLINLDNIDKLVGMDIQENALKLSREVFLQNDLTQPLVRGTVYNLPFQDEQFDLTVCLQVLEHLEDLDTAMREVSRITKRYCLLSVPNEPLFRMANVLRGQYLKTKGNPAAHIQHFGQRSFVKFVERYFNIVAVQTPAFIWNMVLAEKVTRGTTHD